MKSLILIAVSIAVMSTTAHAALQATASSSAGSWCYSECTTAGANCLYVLKCSVSNSNNVSGVSSCSSSATGTCYVGSSGGKDTYCDYGGEDACSLCMGGKQDKYSDWTNAGSNRVSRIKYTPITVSYYECNHTSTTEYGCAANYYTTGSRSSSMTCTACPSNATCGGIGNADGFTCNKGYYKNGSACTACGGDATTKGAGATSQSECYIPSGTSFSDDVGSGAYTDDCYY